jgi:hypothetical protein
LPVIDSAGDPMGSARRRQVRGQRRPPSEGHVSSCWPPAVYIPGRVYSIDAVQVVVSGVVNTNDSTGVATLVVGSARLSVVPHGRQSHDDLRRR